MGAIREVPVYLGTLELSSLRDGYPKLVAIPDHFDFKQAPSANTASGFLL